MRFEVIRWNGGGPPVEEDLRRRLTDEGWSVVAWTDRPGASYDPHAHDRDESLWVVAGEITFGALGGEHQLGPGDRLMLPRGTVHTARAGRDGASYLIGGR